MCCAHSYFYYIILFVTTTTNIRTHITVLPIRLYLTERLLIMFKIYMYFKYSRVVPCDNNEAPKTEKVTTRKGPVRGGGGVVLRTDRHEPVSPGLL